MRLTKTAELLGTSLAQIRIIIEGEEVKNTFFHEAFNNPDSLELVLTMLAKKDASRIPKAKALLEQPFTPAKDQLIRQMRNAYDQEIANTPEEDMKTRTKYLLLIE